MPKSLKELRQEAGLTQLEVAYRLGVTPHTVYMWETGKREPLARAFVRLARLYDVSPFDIALPEDDQGGELEDGAKKAAA